MKYFQEGSFLHSSFSENGAIGSLNDFHEWYNQRKLIGNFQVVLKPLGDSKQWQYDLDAGKLKHISGKFFSIEGISINTNYGLKKSWDQIIINQPEIGILGIIVKKIDGILHFLMQAKMEPGNINILQLSPTLQATKSNYKQIHKGKTPLYLDYFIDRKKSKIIVDQLQTEQGGRFLKKRNRNMIVEVFEDFEIHDDFYWLTLNQLKKLLTIDNLVNMDSRSVISCIPFEYELNSLFLSKQDEYKIFNEFKFLRTLLNYNYSLNTIDKIISWISGLKTDFEIDITNKKITDLDNWEMTDFEIKHKVDNRFSAIMVDVKAENREVSSWDQPLIKELNIGLIGFLVKIFNNSIHFLVQAKVEPGNIDKFDFAPTVSFSNYIEIINKKEAPEFYKYFIKAKNSNILFDSLQSEEGGRFYHFQNRNMVVLIEEDIDLTENYVWMSLKQVYEFLKLGYFNIESRSLISLIDYSLK